MKKSITLKNFSDYRVFLQAHAQEMKSRNTQWSYGAWAKRLGLKATSSITKVVQGQRAPGTQITAQLIRYFEFTRDEADYFKDLVELDRVKSDDRLRALILDRVANARAADTLPFTLDDQTFRLISRWYCLPIREMTRLPGFPKKQKDQAAWIARRLRFKVSIKEIQDAIGLLLETGLLARITEGTDAGLLQMTSRAISTKSDLASEAIRRFHHQMIANADQSLETVTVDEREFISSTLLIRKNDLAEAKKTLREFRAQFARKFEFKPSEGPSDLTPNKTNGQELYQLQLQLFPLTENKRGQ